MRMIAKDVPPVRRKVVRFVQPHGEVGRKISPEGKGSQVLGSIAELAIGRRGGQGQMHQVRHQDGPRQHVGAGEPEQSDQGDEGHAVEEDGGGLQPAREGHAQRRKANACGPPGAGLVALGVSVIRQGRIRSIVMAVVSVNRDGAVGICRAALAISHRLLSRSHGLGRCSQSGVVDRGLCHY